MRDKTEGAALALLACSEVKFKLEAVDNLKAWSKQFEREALSLEAKLFSPGCDHEQVLNELVNSDLPAWLEEALLHC